MTPNADSYPDCAGTCPLIIRPLPTKHVLKFKTNHASEKIFYEVGKRLFFQRGGPHDFACSSCHGEDGKRIRLQDLPNLTKNPGDGVGFAAWPAYRVSNGQMWGMQQRLNDCYRQQRFPYVEFGSDVTIALSTYMGLPFYFGGTALLIVVGVSLLTPKGVRRVALVACLARGMLGAAPLVVDPEPGRVALARELGLAASDVPAGEHEVVVHASGNPDGLVAALSIEGNKRRRADPLGRESRRPGI